MCSSIVGKFSVLSLDLKIGIQMLTFSASPFSSLADVLIGLDPTHLLPTVRLAGISYSNEWHCEIAVLKIFATILTWEE